jgi:hypothetical protein
MLTQSGILYLLYPVADFTNNLFTKVFGIGKMFAVGGEEGSFLTIG